MLILVAVTVRVAINSGLFGHAKDATERWADAQNQEGLIGNDNSIEDTVNKYTQDGEDNYPEPTNPEYFTYEFDEETKTAKLTGVKEEYSERRILYLLSVIRILRIVIIGRYILKMELKK